MTASDAFARAEHALGARYRLERAVAENSERVLFVGQDKVLNRRVSIRVNFTGEDPLRAWFLREAEALAQLDHPAIRHVYDVGVVGEIAYRVGNWIDGESLETAAARGPRLYPAVHALARDVLSALEHSHTQGILVRRIVPAGMILSHSGRGTVTDLRFCSWALPAIPPGIEPSGKAFMAPEVRDGAVGEPASDIYTAGAVLYFALTGMVPEIDPEAIPRPSDLRPTTPRAVERIVIRALQRDPRQRYMSAAEMLEDVRAKALLRGYRGRPVVDEAAYRATLMRISRLLELCPEIEELDLNPVIVTSHGAHAVDARIRITPRATEETQKRH